ncbi:MAG: SpoIID/LytB domain-containing protein [Thermosynechococcaceae cyanobacterium]
MGLACAIAATALMAVPVGAAPLNPELNIGVRQRFGQNPKDQLVLQALPGDRLTVTFPNRGKPATWVTDKIQIAIAMEPLAQPRQDERLVLSSHRSFESAETSANYWRKQGVETEIAQPDNWQVWAKRDRYDSTVTRLLLLQDLKMKGLTTGRLERKTWTAIPKLSWVANGYRFNRNEIDIAAGKNIIQVGTHKYGGRLHFQPNSYGTYTLVNRVPVETYLRGVVPYEIGQNAPQTAVEAQTILARTYALRNLRRFQIDRYELCADTQCQVYEGLGTTNPMADAAIAATTGQVLTYNNELIDALYSSTTGGVTAPFEDVWEGTARPYLKARIDASPNRIWDLKARSLADEKTFRDFIQLKKGFNEDGWGYLRWSAETPVKQLNQELRDFLKKQQNPLAKFGTLTNVEVVSRSAAGRVQRVRATTDIGTIELTKDEVLLAFSAPNSLLFYVDPVFQNGNPQNGATAPKTLLAVKFVGGGLGHGVGLSQTGSYALSQMGWSASQILSFYYPNTILQPLTDKIAYWREMSVSPTPVKQSATDDGEGWSIFGWKFPELGLQPFFQWIKSLVA